MRLMREESFAPIVGIMPVSGDDEAVALMNDSDFGLTASVWTRDARGSAYMAPQCVVGVSHAMRLMSEESFAPIVGIMPVSGDDEAVALMNDSRFGLTASVWTRDAEAAAAIGDRVATGTFFLNRCDYLDPALAWVGIKDSGRGCALSDEAYTHLTRPKSFHLRHGA
jgi:acyl-CoA reductase-like NAD-dependent aldehyde dehydrogenase